MNGFLSQFLTSEIQMVLIALLVMLVVIYVLSIFWAVRDAQSRGFASSAGRP